MTDPSELYRVAQTQLAKAWVSTVSLGLEYAFGEPLIFETMVFVQARRPRTLVAHWDTQCWRWPSKELARIGHGMVVAEVRSAFPSTVERRAERRRLLRTLRA